MEEMKKARLRELVRRPRTARPLLSRAARAFKLS